MFGLGPVPKRKKKPNPKKRLNKNKNPQPTNKSKSVPTKKPKDKPKPKTKPVAKTVAKPIPTTSVVINKSKTITLFTDRLMYSPLDFQHFRKELMKEGIRLTKNPKEADIISSSYMHVLKKYLTLRKKYLLWSHEPYHDFTYKPLVTAGNQKIHVMNVYTGDVFRNNYRYFYFKHKLPLLTEENFPSFGDSKKTVIAFSTKYAPEYYEGNKYTTLPKRYEIINWGYKHKKLKVWGKNWGNMAEGNSRNAKDKGAEKGKILEDYDFNVALENTDVKHYVTEKIWESITNFCLPIYWSNSTIYQDFPKDSFLDYRDFNGPKELFEYIEKMTVKEFRTRMNRCIEVFNRLVDENPNHFYPCPKNQNIEKVDYSQCYPTFLDKIKKLAGSS